MKYRMNRYHKVAWFWDEERRKKEVTHSVIAKLSSFVDGKEFVVTEVNQNGGVREAIVDGKLVKVGDFSPVWSCFLTPSDAGFFVCVGEDFGAMYAQGFVSTNELIELFGRLEGGVGVAVMGEGETIHNARELKEFLVKMLPKLSSNLGEAIDKEKENVVEIEKSIAKMSEIKAKADLMIK